MQELKKKYNRLDTAAAMKLYREGKTDGQMEGILGISRKTIARWRYANKLAPNGKPCGNPNTPSVDYTRIAQLVGEGKTTTEIMGIMGVCRSTVTKWRRENGCAGKKGNFRKQVSGAKSKPRKNPSVILEAVGYTDAGRPLYMLNSEIRFSFKEAANQRNMLIALAELNLCPVDEMIDHLETLGFDMTEFQRGMRRRVMDYDKAKALYDAGASDAEIAKEFGVKTSTVSSWRIRNNLPNLIDRRRSEYHAHQNSG